MNNGRLQNIENIHTGPPIGFHLNTVIDLIRTNKCGTSAQNQSLSTQADYNCRKKHIYNISW